MIHTKVDILEGLASGVLPITPLTKTFSVLTGSGKKLTVSRQQIPITPVYAFTNYRSQVQTIDHCIIDLATPPVGKLTPLNAYIALSWSWGRDSIQLLCDFDECLFTHHPSEHLHIEDEWLVEWITRQKRNVSRPWHPINPVPLHPIASTCLPPIPLYVPMFSDYLYSPCIATDWWALCPVRLPIQLLNMFPFTIPVTLCSRPVILTNTIRLRESAMNITGLTHCAAQAALVIGLPDPPSIAPYILQ